MVPDDSVVLLHDGPRLWLVERAGGAMHAFRRPLPDGFSFDDPQQDWEDVFAFLPDDILIPVRLGRSIATVPHGSCGRPAHIFSFDAALPAEPPPPSDPLGPIVEGRLGRANEYAQDGRLADAETQIAVFALALDRLKHGGRGI